MFERWHSHIDQQLPPLTQLSVEGYAISDYNDLERAGSWLECLVQGCRNRAYLTALHPTKADAIGAVALRGLALSQAVLPSRPAELTRRRPLRFNIWHVQAINILGRDYRDSGCHIPNASLQLREGRGTEPAWVEIQRQRDDEDVEGALLPGLTSVGDMFLFVSAGARLRRREKVTTIEWSADRF